MSAFLKTLPCLVAIPAILTNCRRAENLPPPELIQPSRMFDSSKNVAPATAASIRAIAAGSHHGLALDADGKVLAWGGESFGETQVPSDLSTVLEIAAGSDFSVALQNNGKVRVWGSRMIVNEFVSPDKVVSIAAGGSWFATVLSDGSVRAFGSIVDGEKLVKGLRDIGSIALGKDFLVALTKAGELKFKTTMRADDFQNPAVPPRTKSVKSIAAGAHHVLELFQNGRVRAWGPNYEGENDVPEDLDKVVKLAAGYSSSFALLANGTIRSWGNRKNGEDQLPADLKQAVDISVGQFTCRLVLNAAGHVFSWGQYPCDMAR
jgi:alpha-tubulin suppressor-like RCC1 family protein